MMRIGGAPNSAPHAQCFYLRTTRMKGRTDADGRATAAAAVGARTKKDGRECNQRSGGGYAAAAPTYSEDEDVRVRRAKEGRKNWREARFNAWARSASSHRKSVDP